MGGHGRLIQLGFEPFQQRDVLTQMRLQLMLIKPLQGESGLQLQIAQFVQYQSLGSMARPSDGLLQKALQQ
ncbi:hypothetical protein AAW02_08810 [Aeromonas dhakensis]|nr:hypothetical protein AAW03_15530 [Aeromonas dhakensis]PHS88007.1 hypothetical protein AAW02_08810 [Aeromonas dhakensis]